jgi:hypothetical protein
MHFADYGLNLENENLKFLVLINIRVDITTRSFFPSDDAVITEKS